MEKVTLLTRLGILLGRTVSTEEEATAGVEARVTTLQQEVQSLQPTKAFATAVIAELGVADTSAALTRVREMKAAVTAAENAAREAKKVALATKRAAILEQFKDRYVPAEKPFLETALTADLEAGTDAIEKMLTARPKSTITLRASGADNGKNRPAGEAALDDKVKTFMRDEKLSYADALERAEAEIAEEQRVASTTNG